ncbi:MAG: alpha-L-rhamnosidase C-terminal domain-containing protein, partial [Armatimonadota bacterium]
SIRGRIVSSGTRSAGGALVWEVTVPANTTALAEIPAPPGARITEGGKPLVGAYPSGGRTVVPIGGGTWRFEVLP